MKLRNWRKVVDEEMSYAFGDVPKTERSRTVKDVEWNGVTINVAIGGKWAYKV